MSAEPIGELTIRTLAMPADTNPNGDIFGGWVVSQMDLAGMGIAQKYAPHRTTTVAIDKMVFIAPVKVGDFICCYGKLLRIGTTSITVQVQTWAVAADDTNRRQVTEGVLTYVAIDQNGRPEPALKD
jgi:acyl-CoA thioesterase YciA